MKSSLQILLFLCVAFALWQCSEKATQPKRVRLGEQLILKSGASVTFEGDSLSMTLGQVLQDSRIQGNQEPAFWRGFAEIILSVKRRGLDPATVPVGILGGDDGVPADTIRVDTLGFCFELLRLDPYPLVEGQAPDSSHQATLRVTASTLFPSPTHDVVITTVPPESLLRSSCNLEAATVAGDTITIEVTAAGCSWHYFWLCMSPDRFSETYPPQADLYLLCAQSSQCTSNMQRETIRFLVSPVAAQYQSIHGSISAIVISVHVHDPIGMEQAASVTYLPPGTLLNHPPQLVRIESQSAVAGDTISLEVHATDPDSTVPLLSAELLPQHADFQDRGDGTGDFEFRPDSSDVGSHDVRFIASDGTLADTLEVTISVSEKPNSVPVLSPIGDQSVNEGDSLRLMVSAADSDGTVPNLAAYSLPMNSAFEDSSNGRGVFMFRPDFDQAGEYSVLFTASDGFASDSEWVRVVVENVNRAPVLQPVGVQQVKAGDSLSFTVTASDPDGTIPSLSAIGLPTGAALHDNGNGTGTFSFQTEASQIGDYPIVVIASDGTLADSVSVMVSVREKINHAPTLYPIGDKSGREGTRLWFLVGGYDPDGNRPCISVVNLPLHADYYGVPSQTYSIQFNFCPDYSQAGTYYVLFIASDGELADSETVRIVVEDFNPAPVLATIGTKSAVVDSLLSFQVSATDPDSTIPTLRANHLPTGAQFADSGNGAGSFKWVPSQEQIGTFTVDFVASDGTFEDSETVSIVVSTAIVSGVEILPIGPQSVVEGDTLSFSVLAVSNAGTVSSISCSFSPSDPRLIGNPRSFVNHKNGSGTFTFVPEYTQAGSFTAKFIATLGAAADTETVPITVIEAGNHAPIWTSVVPIQTTFPGHELVLKVAAKDLDDVGGGSPLLSAVSLPAGATFVRSGNAGTLRFTPSSAQIGTSTIEFIASDATDPSLTNALPVESRVHELLNSQGSILPAAVGNYWVYEITTYTKVCPPEYTMQSCVESTVITYDSVTILGSYAWEDGTGWITDRYLPVLPAQFTMRNDTIFCTYEYNYATQGASARYYPLPPGTSSYPHGAAGTDASGSVVPMGAFVPAYWFNFATYDEYYGSDKKVTFVPGVGIIYISSSSGKKSPMPGECYDYFCTYASTAYRLLRYHIQ